MKKCVKSKTLVEASKVALIRWPLSNILRAYCIIETLENENWANLGMQLLHRPEPVLVLQCTLLLRSVHIPCLLTEVEILHRKSQNRGSIWTRDSTCNWLEGEVALSVNFLWKGIVIEKQCWKVLWADDLAPFSSNKIRGKSLRIEPTFFTCSCSTGPKIGWFSRTFFSSIPCTLLHKSWPKLKSSIAGRWAEAPFGPGTPSAINWNVRLL